MRRGKERQTLLAMLLLLVLAVLGDARSPPSPPLRRLHTPSSSLEILPRQHPHLSSRSYIQPHPSTLLHSDTVFLTINLASILPFPAHLLLHPTEHLFHPEARITYQSGESEPLRAEDWRLYSGLVVHPRWAERMKWEEMSGLHDPRSEALASIGRASIMVHDHGGGNPTYEGSFTLDGVTHHILTKTHYDKVRTAEDVEAALGDMVVFRDQDMHENQPANTTTGCSHDLLEANLFKRDDIAGGVSGGNNYINSIGNPAGCPDSQKLLYMGVALDCNYVSTYSSPSDARTQVLNNWNQASALYKSTFNVSLGIVELQVQNQTCGTTAPSDAQFDVSCDAGLTMDQRLSLFSQWRGDRSNDGIGLWHLMSACPTDTEVGVAWLGTLCQTSSNQQSGSYVSGTGMSTASKTEWSLISHEIGHGFGAIHDCTSGCSLSGPCCPLTSSSCDAGGSFIMNPTTSTTEQTFSQCTLGNICSGLGSNTVSSSCLATPGQGQRTVISLQQCGNGIVDSGEDCDPGVGANSTCCDASTCKFRSGAVCDPSNSACCTSSCQFSSSGTVCRPAVDPTCDIAEQCSGSSADCPADKTASDGKFCGSGLSCAAGQCTSLDLQCQKAGTSMNLTTACGQKDDKSCVISCKDPTTANQCIVLQTPLLTGSPCGYGGHCYNQTCQAGSWQDTAGAWYRSNLQISIPVTIVAALLALAIIIFIIRCIYRGCCGRRPRPRQAILPPPQRSSMRQSVYNPVTPSRNPDSVSSQDPIATTAVRDPSPNGEYSNGYGAVPQSTPPRQPDFSTPPTQYYTPQNRRQPDLYSSPVPPPPPSFPDPTSYGGNPYGQSYRSQQYPAQNTWVDASAYNGPHYGPNEAYGR